ISLPLSDVSNRGGDQRALGGLDRAQADLRGELGAVLAAREELEACPHRPGSRLAGVSASMARVPVPEALPDQELDRLPNELRARVAEQLLGLGIDEEDPPVRIDDHHRIGGSLEEPSKLVLGLRLVGALPLVLKPPELGDVLVANRDEALTVRGAD